MLCVSKIVRAVHISFSSHCSFLRSCTRLHLPGYSRVFVLSSDDSFSLCENLASKAFLSEEEGHGNDLGGKCYSIWKLELKFTEFNSISSYMVSQRSHADGLV